MGVVLGTELPGFIFTLHRLKSQIASLGPHFFKAYVDCKWLQATMPLWKCVNLLTNRNMRLQKVWSYIYVLQVCQSHNVNHTSGYITLHGRVGSKNWCLVHKPSGLKLEHVQNPCTIVGAQTWHKPLAWRTHAIPKGMFVCLKIKSSTHWATLFLEKSADFMYAKYLATVS